MATPRDIGTTNAPESRVRAIRVKAPARLHLGFLDLNGALGRQFGSIGLAVDQPSTKLSVIRASAFSASGAEAERALHAVRRFAHTFAANMKFSVDVERAIPAHAGLGSGTQLALAIGAGVLKLAGLRRPGQEVGELVDRGGRSAIGMAAFEQGGFIVDGGRGLQSGAPPVIIRTDFPEAWRAILILDDRTEGVHGETETKAFASLAPFPEATAAHICHLVLMRLVPGIRETDIGAFGTALTEIQDIIGHHFASAQGGHAWSSPAVGRLAYKLRDAGATGIGQSSWGPTGFAFMPSEEAAKRLYHSFVQDAMAEGLKMLIVRGRNSGARIEGVES